MVSEVFEGTCAAWNEETLGKAFSVSTPEVCVQLSLILIGATPSRDVCRWNVEAIRGADITAGALISLIHTNAQISFEI